MCTPPPENVGSGKFGRPCARTHAAAFRYSVCSAGLTTGCLPRPPPGSSLRQACWAEESAWFPLPTPAGTAIFTLTSLPLWEICGSGKLGTPCERIQAENATAWLPGEDSPPPGPAVGTPAVELVARVLDPRWATPPVGEPPPQPAASRPTAIGVAANTAARRRRAVVVPRSLVCSVVCVASPCMSSPSQLEVVLCAACTTSAVSRRYRRVGGSQIQASCAGAAGEIGPARQKQRAKPCRNRREVAWGARRLGN